jgi:hypothetical protein
MAKFGAFYIVIGIFLWVCVPMIEGASGKRPKFWKCVLAWGPAVFLPMSGPLFIEWMWRK